jgi:TusA-related sulfurtransferase
MDQKIKDSWNYDAEYNGKEEGCGELIMKLFVFFKAIKPGMKVCITAHDIGAPREIASWCRQTGKILHQSKHPFYLIEKK